VTMTVQRKDQRQAVIEDLRTLVAFLAEHPQLPVDARRIEYCVLADDDAQGIAEVQAIARTLGVEMTSSGGHYHAERRFGSVTYRAFYVTRGEMAIYDAVMSYRNAVRPETGGAA
jgi:hypothetical protein